MGLPNIMDSLAAEIIKTANEHGFWDGNCSEGEKIALMHSELSKVLEALRNGNPLDKHCPGFSSVEIEYADCIIRILDTCYQNGYRIGSAIVAKMVFNKTRPYKHGKKF